MAKSLRQSRHRSRILAMQAMFQYDARGGAGSARDTTSLPVPTDARGGAGSARDTTSLPVPTDARGGAGSARDTTSLPVPTDAQHDEKPGIEELSSFQWIDYAVPEDEREFARVIIRHTLEHIKEIDELITERLVNWEFSRISPVSRAILRTGVAQLLYMATDADAAVVIDESILLAKQYDSAETTGFINGLLDDVRSMKTPEALPVKKVAAGDKIKIRKRIK